VNPVHIAQQGTYITTPEISEASARINVKTQLENEGKDNASLAVITRFVTAKGVETGKVESKVELKAGEKKEISETTEIKSPQLWSCESPSLYHAVTEVYQNGQLIDKEINKLGIRKISFDANNGFQLNGKTVKLKGGCF